jgi:hypothetical protein
VDTGLGGAGIASKGVLGSTFKMEIEEGFSQKESAESMFFAKSDNRYIVVVPFRNVAPLGFVVNWLAINQDAVILS